jgi:hypothetical protein
LYYFDSRWYDPNLGRFITEDPARDGGNWFAYCGNNPLNFTDPTGLDASDFYASLQSGQYNSTPLDPHSYGSLMGQSYPTPTSPTPSAPTPTAPKPSTPVGPSYTPHVEYGANGSRELYDPNSDSSWALADATRDAGEAAAENSARLGSDPVDQYIGFCLGVPFINFSISLDVFNGDISAGFSRHLIGAGVSLDYAIGNGSLETSVGASKYLSVGVLWNEHNGVFAPSGTAYHVGPGVGLPFDISYPK